MTNILYNSFRPIQAVSSVALPLPVGPGGRRRGRGGQPGLRRSRRRPTPPAGRRPLLLSPHAPATASSSSAAAHRSIVDGTVALVADDLLLLPFLFFLLRTSPGADPDGGHRASRSLRVLHGCRAQSVCRGCRGRFCRGSEPVSAPSEICRWRYAHLWIHIFKSTVQWNFTHKVCYWSSRKNKIRCL